MILMALGFTTACVTETSGGRQYKESKEDAAAYNFQLGVEYLRSGKLQLARERLESSISQNPKNADAHYTLAIVYQRVNEEKLADQAYRSAIRLAPDDGSVQNSYAVYLCGQKEYRQAEQYFVKAARNPLYSTPAAALTNAGVCMRSKDDLDAAERYFRNALEIKSDYADALLQLAVLKFETDNALSSRAFLQRLMSAGVSSADVLLLAWRVETQLGDQRAAGRYADELRERFPESRQTRVLEQGG